MKSISLLASLAAVSAICVSVSCSSKSDGGGAGGTPSGGTSSGGTNSGGDTANGGKGGKTSGGDTSTAGENSAAGDNSTAGDGTGNAAGAGPVGSCSQGVLFEGDPLYDSKAEVPGPKVTGQGLLADPPIQGEAVAVIGNKFFIETEFEIWSADMSAATPTISRIAGTDPSGFVNAGVACKDTQFLVMRDMVATAQGKLAVVDYVGGAVIEITDPGGPNCKSNWVAGTHAKTADPGPDFPLAQGDMDGPGATALFGGVGGGGGLYHLTADPAGNIYVYDNGVGKFKMIGIDAARTVKTIGADLDPANDNVRGLAFLKGKLYAVGVDGTNDFLEEIDPATYTAATPKKNVKDIFRARGSDHFPDVPGGNATVPSEVLSDGEALIMAAESGFVWRVGADGTVLATLAGSGKYIDYMNGFDPLVPHPATEWQLVDKGSSSFGGPWLAFDAGKLYWSGGLGINKYVVQFSCP